jgi:hypothetical protein
VLPCIYRTFSHTPDSVKLALITAMTIVLIVFHHQFSWLLLAAILSAGIDFAYPHIKRRAGLPDWTPNEAYITKLRHRRRTSKETNDPAAWKP